MNLFLEQLQGMLDKKRYDHCLGVMDTAMRLADFYGADKEKAAVAGLLHDCARGLSEEELLALARKEDMCITDVEIALPVLLHAPVGALLARRQFGIVDEEVLNSIVLHTLGNNTMNLLDKIVFVADKIEPGRRFPGVERLREKAFQNLDQSLLSCLDMSIDFAVRAGKPIHQQSINVRNKLLRYVKDK